MKLLLSLICSVILLCGFTYGYRNNTQTGKPDLVVIGAASGDVSGLGGFSLLTPGTLTNNNLCTTNGTTIACTTTTSTFQPAGSYLTANQSITLSGDATGSGATAITVNVGKINGDVVDSAARATGDFLRYDGSQWRHVPLASGDIPANAANTTGSAAKWATGRTVAISGPITYTSPSLDGSGNVTAAATVTSQTGTGSTFVMDTAPTLVVPNVGVAAANSYAVMSMTGNARGGEIDFYNGVTLLGSLSMDTSGTVNMTGNVVVGSGTAKMYYCNAGASVNNLCRGNGCSCVAGTWVDTGLRIK